MTRTIHMFRAREIMRANTGPARLAASHSIPFFQHYLSFSLE